MKDLGPVLQRIQKCKNCALYNNQTPLLDNKTEADVMWVGLSAVKVDCTQKETPLSNKTNTGRLISEIEKLYDETHFYKTNLVKCLPLRDDGKIRSPKNQEIKSCRSHISFEIRNLKPKVVFLLGKQVINSVLFGDNLKFSDDFIYEPVKQGNTLYIPVHHPSYILIYKRKNLNMYIQSISELIEKFASGKIT